MRTSFHHQSEAEPPNGPLTAATSPDTPSAAPASHSVSNAYGIGSRSNATIPRRFVHKGGTGFNFAKIGCPTPTQTVSRSWPAPKPRSARDYFGALKAKSYYTSCSGLLTKFRPCHANANCSGLGRDHQYACGPLPSRSSYPTSAMGSRDSAP